LTYWIVYALKNHPAVRALVDTHREFKAKRSYNPSRVTSVVGSLNGLSEK